MLNTQPENNPEPTDLAGIHVSLMQRMGVDIDKFGTAEAPYQGLEG